jgi:phosphatidylglycerophosphate synthase
MFNKSQIPSGVTLIRLFLTPIFFLLVLSDQYFLSVLILALAGFTDFLDGYLARRLGFESNTGAFLDVVADFVLILTGFLAFIIKGWYDPLILLLIIFMFILFIASSGREKPVYDPVGKYLGSYLMGMMFVSIIIPEPIIRLILLIILALMSIISIISRFITLYVL